jgi:hypothetical protein
MFDEGTLGMCSFVWTVLLFVSHQSGTHPQ